MSINKYNNGSLAIKESNIIPIEVLRFPKPEPKPLSSKARAYNGGGHPAGQSSEVYAFRTDEEIKAMIDVFNERIENARDKHVRQIAERDKLLFVVGINTGCRASDLRTLQYDFFMDLLPDGTLRWKEFYSFQPKKQKKSGKFVKLYFNNTVKKAVESYIEKYPFNDISDYVFASREGGEPITEKTLWRIIKSTAKEAGIQQNIGSHSMRKTWGRFCVEKAEDKTKALLILQKAFGHSSQMTTLKYLGILDEDIKDMYESVELGFDMI